MHYVGKAGNITIRSTPGMEYVYTRMNSVTSVLIMFRSLNIFVTDTEQLDVSLSLYLSSSIGWSARNGFALSPDMSLFPRMFP